MVNACAQPTQRYPDGREGTAAGYQAHRGVGEEPCASCYAAHISKGKSHWESLSDEQRDTRRERNRAERKRHLESSPETARAAKHRIIARNRKVLFAAKDVPCADCGIRYPYYVMQFDHLADKSFQIGPIGRSCSLARLEAEMAKCEVVCANCHAERSHRRLMQKLGRSSEAI